MPSSHSVVHVRTQMSLLRSGKTNTHGRRTNVIGLVVTTRYRLVTARRSRCAIGRTGERHARASELTPD